jgi:acyl carrier protein
MDTKQKIIDTLVDLLKVKPQELKEGVTLLDSIGVDSTEMVEVVITMGKSFGIKIDTKEITKFSTPEDIVKTVESKLGNVSKKL